MIAKIIRVVVKALIAIVYIAETGKEEKNETKKTTEKGE